MLDIWNIIMKDIWTPEIPANYYLSRCTLQPRHMGVIEELTEAKVCSGSIVLKKELQKKVHDRECHFDEKSASKYV